MATLMQNILFISGQARYGLAWLILDVQAERGRGGHHSCGRSDIVWCTRKRRMATLIQNILFISGQACYGLAWLILDVQAERGRSSYHSCVRSDYFISVYEKRQQHQRS